MSRVRMAMDEHHLEALLLFETSNIRYLTSTHIGYWAFNKGERYALITRNGDFRIWDFGSAAKAHRLQHPTMGAEQSIAGNTGLQGAIGPATGLRRDAAQEIASVLREEGVTDLTLGVDMSETTVLLELQKAGIPVVDGQQTMMTAREIKNQDEIMLLSQACAMVDGVYQDIFEALKPGIRESDIVALAHKRLFEMGSEFVEAVNSIAGERCSPHPHVFSDRLIRPGDQAYFDIIHVYNGYRTCYYRTFAVGRASQAHRDAFKQSREWMDAAIDLVKILHHPLVSRPSNSVADFWIAHQLGIFLVVMKSGLDNRGVKLVVDIVIVDLAIVELARFKRMTGTIAPCMLHRRHAKHLQVTSFTNDMGGKVYELHGPLFFASVKNFGELFDVRNDPDDVVVEFKYSRVYDHSAIEAIDALAERYLKANKRLHLRHISPECQKLLTKAGNLVEVNVIEDPKYFVADDQLA